MRNLQKIFGLCLCVGCSGGPVADRVASTPAAAAPSDRNRQIPISTAQDGLEFTLSEGDSRTPRPDRTPEATTRELSSREADRLLGRLSALPEPRPETFQLPVQSRRRPAAQTVERSFPPEKDRTRPAVLDSEGPLRIVRRAPEGSVTAAARITVTFDEPIGEIGADPTIADDDPPFRLTPPTDGRWRWLSPKTLVFETESGRLPMATSFKVTARPSWRSPTGRRFDERFSWSFETPAPRVVGWHPSGNQVRPQVIQSLDFDQAVDPDEIRRFLVVKAGDRSFPIRAPTDRELTRVQSEDGGRPEPPGRTRVPFITTEPLPLDTPVTVALTAGWRGREGPRRAVGVVRHKFSTYPPLALRDSRCGWRMNCPPFSSPFYLEFNNRLDPEVFDPSSIRVEPAIPDLEVELNENVISLRGITQGRTTYKVTAAGSVTDVFGQKLGADETVEFAVGAADPHLVSMGQPMRIQDPAAPNAFEVSSVNYRRLEVRAWRMKPKDWAKFLRGNPRDRDNRLRRVLGRPQLSRTVRVKGEPDQLNSTAFDLSRVFGDRPGHAVIEIIPPRTDLTGWRRENPPVVQQWLQKTELAVQVRVDATRLLAWVSALTNGAPVSGATVELYPLGLTATTDPGGLASFDLPDDAKGNGAMVIARQGSDSVFVPESLWRRSHTSWSRTKSSELLRAFVFDDRHIYRPGEDVKIKGWLRIETPGPKGDLQPLDGRIKTLQATFFDGWNTKFAETTVTPNRWGGFDLAFRIPDDASLGPARVQFTAKPQTEAVRGLFFQHRYEIQTFRRPEFEVRVDADAPPYLVGEFTTFETEARYYAGGPLPDASVDWQVSSVPSEYQPPGFDDYAFGRWRPWWLSLGPLFEVGESSTAHRKEFTSRTNSAGRSRLRVDLTGIEPPEPTTVRVSAAVTDRNRQTWSGDTSVLVHPANLYVGLKADQGFTDLGQPTAVPGVVVDIDGRPAPGHTVTATLARLAWERDGKRWSEVERDPLSCRATTDPEGRFNCEFKPTKGGRYRLSAEIRDERNRRNRTTRTLWISGRSTNPDRSVNAERVRLVPDRARYEPGETARILIQAPFADAQGLLTVEREGIASTTRFAIDGASHVVEVPIADNYLPRVRVAVELVGRTSRDDAPERMRPAFAHGEIDLAVSERHRRLFVEARPVQRLLEPGAPAAVDVRVTDADGQPVSDAEVAIVVVDEAILALTGRSSPNAIAAMYPPRSAGVRIIRTRDRLQLGSAKLLAETLGSYRNGRAAGFTSGAVENGDMMVQVTGSRIRRRAVLLDGERKTSRADEAIVVRKNFSALANFSPAEITGADGTAKVTFTLPDSVTRYRIIAVAADAQRRFGSGESSLTARKTLVVRPSAPRFLNYGDRAEVPVIVQNAGDIPLEVSLALRARNARLAGDRGLRFTVPGGDRREVRFPIETERAGQASFQVAASAGELTDAAQFTLPVYSPATTEAFAAYGTTSEEAVVQPLRRPRDVVPTFGGLEISTASTQLQSLTDAYLYLRQYPFECSEQIASRVLSTVALKDVLAAFDAKDLPSPEATIAATQQDIERLVEMQRWDGGWGFWTEESPGWPFLTTHVMHALVRARAKGLQVPSEPLRDGHRYLRRIERHIPRDYPEPVKISLQAYALYVRSLMGDLDEPRALKLIRQSGGIDRMPLETLGWLYPVLIDGQSTQSPLAQLRRRLNNDATETAGEAHFVTRYEDGAHLLLHSNRRIDALLLDGLLQDRPQDPMVPKLVKGLLAHRTQGRWSSTQENTWVLLALERYFRVYEKVTPDFVARIWLGDRFAGEQAYEGRSAEQHRWFVPMAQLGDARDIVLAKTGDGRLYYRLGLRYAPSSLSLPALDRGFVVTRRYEAVDDEGDVTRDADGTWRVRAGAVVRVRLEMVAPSTRYHVALVDALPAGLEPLNPALAVTPDVDDEPELPSSPWWWQRPWFEHQNLRDERVEAFAPRIGAGVYSYDYMARATTPGHYVVPPAKAEQMYAPETFGRSGTNRLIVSAP